jgi:hypothetical protein
MAKKKTDAAAAEPDELSGEGVGASHEKHSFAGEHTEGGVTTRDDATDLGVPMQPGSPDEPVGPEDALGEGPKRGDYRDRIGPKGYEPHEVVPADPEETGGATAKAVKQRPRAEDIGDAEGLKGGVQTREATGRRKRR